MIAVLTITAVLRSNAFLALPKSSLDGQPSEMQTKYYYVDIDKTQSLLERIHSVDLSVAHEK